MKERIIKFLSENNLTSTKFADVVGVQRSSISHILSGRNKPSFDFIEKMLIAYPDLNAQWLITGKGNMLTNQQSLFTDDNISQKTSIIPPLESNIQEIDDNSQVATDSQLDFNLKNEDQRISSKLESNIERVIIFYKNGAFREYKPE